jgi:hypothetical protein
MSAALSEAYPAASNVIPVDFRVAPVLTSYADASAALSETARRLKAEAQGQMGKLQASTDARAGKLRVLSAARGDMFSLNPYLIEIKEGWNCREMSDPANQAHIDGLARSISEIGVQDALNVVLEGDRVFLTDGHCRLLATFRAIEVYGAEIKAVPVIAETRYSNAADHVLRQLLSGKPKSVLEQGNAFLKLINFGWTPAQIAAKAGNVSAVRVQQVLDLMAHANDGIKAMIREGKVAPSEAAQILREQGNDAVKAQAVIMAGLSVATAAGKTKVTRKHIEAASGRLSTKAWLKAQIANAKINEKADTITLVLSFSEVQKLGLV